MGEAAGDRRAGAMSAAAGRRVLDAVQPIIAASYAQWLIEDAHTRAYRVVAARVPPGAAGYDTAHRLGVIGQVFRTGRPIFAADTRAHPLYDPYDPKVEWELAVPAYESGRLAAVLNLEGARPGPRVDGLWARLASVVQAASGAELPATPPRSDEPCLSSTAWVHVTGGIDAVAAALELSRSIAAAGRTTLVVVPAPGAPNDDIEAALSGVAPSIDRLDTVLLDGGPRLPAAWCARLAGRYDYVLSAVRR